MVQGQRFTGTHAAIGNRTPGKVSINERPYAYSPPRDAFGGLGAAGRLMDSQRQPNPQRVEGAGRRVADGRLAPHFTPGGTTMSSSRGSRLQQAVDFFREAPFDEARVTFQLVTEVMEQRAEERAEQAARVAAPRPKRATRVRSRAAAAAPAPLAAAPAATGSTS